MNPPPQITALLLGNDRTYADPDLFTARQRRIELLIGSDQYYCLVKKSIRFTDSSVLLDTLFGWIPAGCFQEPSVSLNIGPASSLLSLGGHSAASTPMDLDHLWSLEAMGIEKKKCDCWSTSATTPAGLMGDLK